MVKIEINGQNLEAEQGSMIIEAADKAGIRIPRFCYHKKLSIAANCRMCLVEVAGGRKPMPACATPVTEGMKVCTNSKLALEAQQAVMEFLLINHPLDCPICDQGGECELQDVSMGYGGDVSQYTEGKRVVKDKNIGPLIATEMTRCIHCTRCVRFGQEIAGIAELGALGRGEHTEIGTYIERSVDSELSGNVIDVCPVGALTAKPSRFKARAWEMKQFPSVSPHDCVGANLYAMTRRADIIRVVPRENEPVNEVWIADRERFSYEGIASDERASKPMVKVDGEWQETDWQTALDKAVAGLMRVSAAGQVEDIGALVSPSCTVEEQFLLSEFMRGFGCNNIDHRLEQQDFLDQTELPRAPNLNISIADIEQLDHAVLVGSNIRKEQPLLGHRLFKMTKSGGVVSSINPQHYSFAFPLVHDLAAVAGAIDLELAAVAKVLDCLPSGITGDVTISERHQALAAKLREGGKTHLFIGTLALNHPNASVIRALCKAIAEKVDATFGELTLGGNAAGAWLTGCVPHRAAGGSVLSQVGLNAKEMLASPRKAYIMMGVEPELDAADSAAALSAMQGAEFIVSISPFTSATMKLYCDVILPMATFAETSGTFINCEGIWQSFSGVTKPYEDARPGWKIIRVLGNLLHLGGFDFTSSEDVLAAFKAKLDSMPEQKLENLQLKAELSAVEGGQLYRLAEKPIYAVDSLVRRAAALQATEDADAAYVAVNSALASSKGFKAGDSIRVIQGQGSAVLPLQINDTLPEQTVSLPFGILESVGLGSGYQEIELQQA